MQISIGIAIWNNYNSGGDTGFTNMDYEGLVTMLYENGVDMEYEI